jgi:hypothetical protein
MILEFQNFTFSQPTLIDIFTCMFISLIKLPNRRIDKRCDKIYSLHKRSNQHTISCSIMKIDHKSINNVAGSLSRNGFIKRSLFCSTMDFHNQEVVKLETALLISVFYCISFLRYRCWRGSIYVLFQFANTSSESRTAEYCEKGSSCD